MVKRRESGGKMARVHFSLEEGTYLSLKRAADLNRETVSALMRRVLKEGLEAQQGEGDELTLMIRRTVRDELRPTEAVLTKAAVQAAIATGTGMYLGVQAAADLGVAGVVELHRRASALASGRAKLPEQ